MTRESLRDEPVVDCDILEQNLELMDEEFPEPLMEDWNDSVLPLIRQILEEHAGMTDDDLRAKTHKCAGSVLQIGGHQLGTSLRTVSHLVQGGSREVASQILSDIPEYLAAFEQAIKDSQNK